MQHDMHHPPGNQVSGGQKHIMEHGTSPHKMDLPGRDGHDTHDMHGTSSRDHHAMMVADFRKRFWISLIITIPVLLLSPGIHGFTGLEGKISFPGGSYLLWALCSAIFFYGGWPFLKGIVSELKDQKPGMMTLIAIAISVAYAYSSAVVFGVTGSDFFWELATLIDVMLLGHWLEMRSVIAASSSLEELARLLPAVAHRVMEDGSTKDFPLDQLTIGDKVLIKPGEKIPADGEVVEGESSVNEAMLTGESTPSFKRAGSTVIGGSVNGEGSLIIEIKKTGKSSYLSQIREMVRQAQESKSRTQNLADHAAFVLTIVSISVGLLTLAIWLWIAHQEFVFALSRMVTVMVITCPHALGLADCHQRLICWINTCPHALGLAANETTERVRNIHLPPCTGTGNSSGRLCFHINFG